MTTLKLVHVSAVTLSIAGFGLRGLWMLLDSPLLQRRLTRVLPHVVDTVLLASGIALALRLHLGPLEQPWLAAKLVALPVYVLLGSLALRRARTPRGRALFFVLALLTALYIVGAALRHSPLSFLA